MLYLSGIIRDDDYECEWLKKRMETWEQNIYTISKKVGKYPQ